MGHIHDKLDHAVIVRHVLQQLVYVGMMQRLCSMNWKQLPKWQYLHVAAPDPVLAVMGRHEHLKGLFAREIAGGVHPPDFKASGTRFSTTNHLSGAPVTHNRL